MKMKSGEFIALSACIMALTALGIDIMLPAFAAIRQDFGLPHDSTATANIVSYFFMGQVAQIVFGILSDRYDRLATFRIGVPLYIISGFATAFSSQGSINMGEVTTGPANSGLEPGAPT